MSNHPENLDIYDSVGPPAGFHPDQGDDDASLVPISGMQDISTFGIAGRIWDSSYTLDVFMRRPTDQHTFTPECPIPAEYFLPAKTSTTSITHESTPPPTTATTHAEKRPIRILEIGAGTGYVGIALAKRLDRSCTVILTDLEEVVPLMQKNVNEHHLSRRPPSPSTSSDTATSISTSAGASAGGECAWVEVEPLAWGNSDHARAILEGSRSEAAGRVDYIVASDLVYFPELYPPLLQTLKEITRVGETKVIFGYKERALWKESPFWEEFGRFFEIEVVRIERHPTKDDKDTKKEGDKEEEEDENRIEVFGCEGDDRMYVFVATKRRDEDILKGADDTLTTLMMMQIGL
ncbi:hypothetical protein BGX29_011346 [Mortierella sp. GBA35]|nr:hypothetical protein BGX29_011346 [Mortierella sp. GBA35]